MPLFGRLTLIAFTLATAGCGSGGSGGAETTAPARNDTSLSVTVTGGGKITSSPSGVSCSSSCSVTFGSATAVTLTAEPATNYAFDRWSGACTGTDPMCSLVLDQAASASASFVPVVPLPGVAYVQYTDALSGPVSGGEGDQGGYLSIFGTNFGAPGGMGSTTRVYIGGVEVANYRYLGASKVAGKLGLQQLTVQVGRLGGAALGAALPVAVVVGGVSSNVNNTFTPSAGRVLFVSLSGNDATAGANDIARPWRYLQNNAAAQGAYFASQAGDQIVIRGGNWSDTNGVDTTWMKANNGAKARNGTASAWIHITAYPGPINGNAIEDVHYTTPAGASGGIAGPWSAIAGTSGEYWSISNLRMDVSGGANRDAAPINFQYSAGPWRVVNNELGPWVAGSSATLNAAGISGHGNGMKILGNHIHNIAGTSELQNHGIYGDTTAQNWEVAYNWIHDATGGSLVQFNDNEGGAGSYALPHGGTWQGFVGMRVHHNWLENAAKYGINYNDQGSVKAGAYEGQHWNNVIIGTALPPLRINSTQPTQRLWFAFNTVYNAMTSSSGSGNAMVRAEGWSAEAGVANKFYDNIFVFGPATVAGTQWFADVGGTAATTTTYDFKRNLYYAGGQSPRAPSTIGDSTALVGNPLFTNAAAADFTTQSGSPARGAALPLPAGFVVLDDFTGQQPRSSGALGDVGAFISP